MPMYDYKCLECNNTFEVLQKMSDERIKSCPKCGGEVKKLISGGNGLVFKGKGYYLTDYKNSSNSTSSAK